MSFLSWRLSRVGVVLFGAIVLCSACGGGGGGGDSSTGGPPGSNQPPVAPTANRAPTVIADERSERVVVDHPFSYDVLQNGPLFSDPDGDPLTYTLSWSMSSSLDPAGTWSGLGISGTRVQGTTATSWTNQVTIEAKDGRGGAATHRIQLVAARNRAPVVIAPNDNKIVAVGESLEFDVTDRGTVFTDPDGDELTYAVTIASAPRGLQINNTVVNGNLNSLGAVRLVVTATDPFGGTATDTLLVAAPSPEPGPPTLPAVSYVYDDALLSWPEIFRLSREITIPFWDTTPAENPTGNAGATLGRVLFYDQRLSITNTHACGSCHEQARGFTVGTAFAAGVTAEPSHRNPMALANARYNIHNHYFSDARVNGLEQLALMPIEDPIELGNSVPVVIEKLETTAFYPALFAAAFGTPEITGDRIARALAQFLRSIVSYRSKFDRAYLPVYPISEADPTLVLTQQELLGAEMFVNGNCGHCHGNNVHTNDRISNNGLNAQFSDAGAGDGTFRAASLRNIEVSGPYMHDGRFATLREVIDHYDSGVNVSADLDFLLRDHQGTGSEFARRLNMTEQQKQALEAFLKTFTDTALLQDPKFSDPFQ